MIPALCDRPDVIVLTDEAHRSQNETRATIAGSVTGQIVAGQRKEHYAKFKCDS